MEHIRCDPVIYQSDIVCLSETWLRNDEEDESLSLNGFKLNKNSKGAGKGLATYFKTNVLAHETDVKQPAYQLTKLTSTTVDIISVYRSREANIEQLLNHLLACFDPSKTTVICGDMNVCFKADRMSKLTTTLEANGFKQYVKEATHIHGGLIDHAYVYKTSDEINVDVRLYSPYYCSKDHDAILVNIDFTTSEHNPSC